MKIRTFYILENDVYQVSLQTEDWNERDVQLMERFGEPEIDLGGDFYVDPMYDPFVLTTNLVRIKSESPFVERFDIRDYADSEDRADAWADEIEVRIRAAIVTLRANDDDFTREEVSEV